MSFKYQIEKGHENRIFADAKNLGDGTVESEKPMESKYLTLIVDQPITPPVTPQQATPLNQTASPQVTQDANKEASK